MDALRGIEEVESRWPQLTVSTLRHLRQTGNGPAAVRIGRRLYYRDVDVQAWLDAKFQEASKK